MADANTAEVQSPDAFDLTLEEFCARLSADDKRVELIAGFYSVEKREGRTKDSEVRFQQRFVNFQNQPV